MKKFIIPAILVSLGTGAAFATSAKGNGSKLPVPAYRIVTVGPNETVCVYAQEDCDTEIGNICKWSGDGSTPLHELDGTMCGDFLYKFPQR